MAAKILSTSGTAARQREDTTAHGDWVGAIDISADGEHVASASADGTIRAWRAPRMDAARTIHEGSGAVYGVHFSPDGMFLAAGTGTGEILLWRTVDWSPAYTLRGHHGGITSVAFSPNGRLLASASFDGTVRIWDLTKCAAICEWSSDEAQEGFEVSLGWSPDGRMLVSVQVIAGESGVLLRDTEAHPDVKDVSENIAGLISQALFSPGGRYIAAAYSDGIVVLWDVLLESPATRLDGHAGAVDAIAYSSNGNRLASSSEGRLYLWDSLTGTLLDIVVGQDGRLVSLRFDPRERFIVSGSEHGVVRTWALDG